MRGLWLVLLMGWCWCGWTAPVELFFAGQEPEAPGVYDAPAGPVAPCGITVENLSVKVVVPSAGVTSRTGVLLMLPGIDGSMDCFRPLFTYDPEWPDDKDVVVAFVYYRNHGFSPPYDLGKLQITDVLRALGVVLRGYPEVDRRRLYLFGGSGGGQVAMQVLQCAPHLWAEVYAHCPMTLITTGEERVRGYEVDPAPLGYNEQLLLPVSRGDLGEDGWRRVRAERSLRSVQKNWAAMLVRAEDREKFPRVFVMHGDTDRTTDFQHFVDLKGVLSAREGGAFVREELGVAAAFSMGRWRMFQIYGGSHSYGTAAEEVASRAKATNRLVPEAFSGRRAEGGELRVDFAFPAQHGWRWRVEGELGECSLEAVECSSGDCDALSD